LPHLLLNVLLICATALLLTVLPLAFDRCC
jgi:hypothetical protein